MADPLGFWQISLDERVGLSHKGSCCLRRTSKRAKKIEIRSLLPALNQAHLELQTKEFTAKYCCIKKDVWVNSFNGSRKILLSSFPKRPLYRNQEQKFNKSHTSSYQSRFERFKYSQIFRRP